MSHVQKLRERLEAKIRGDAEPGTDAGKPPLPAAKASTSAAASSSSSAAKPPLPKVSAPKPVVFSTPEEFAKRQKEAELKEKQNKLQAKQMASKYNMTYRALELQANKSEGPVAAARRASIRRASLVGKPPAAGAGAATAVGAGTGAGATGSTKVDDGYEKFDAVLDDQFWMTELAIALSYEDEGGINRAILREFFEDHDPDRLVEIDQMLIDWAGREDELFAYLTLFYMDEEGVVDDSAERAAMAVFQAANETPGPSAGPPPPAGGSGKKPTTLPAGENGMNLGGMLGPGATATGSATGTTGAPKARRASAISKVALNSTGGIQAAAIATSSSESTEEKVDDAPNLNPYIISGQAHQGVWTINAAGNGAASEEGKGAAAATEAEGSGFL